mgnify:FL=1
MKKLIIIGGLILLTIIVCSSCEKAEMREVCTYSSKPPFMPASIQDPSEEDLFFFRRDWGPLEVECRKEIAL